MQNNLNNSEDRKQQYDPSRRDVPEVPAAPSEVKVRFPLSERVENFWYHYKWHTVVAIILIITVTVASLQMCSRTTYDMYVMYAGGSDVRMTGYDGESSDFERLHSATLRFVSDIDGDGERNLSMLNLYLPSDEQIRELEETLGPDAEINYSLLTENDKTFRDCMLYGEFYICILSEHLLEEWSKNGDFVPFVSIRDYLPDGAKVSTGDPEAAESDEYVLASEYGVYLSSTPIADNPGYSALGSDTVICMRIYSEISNKFNKKESLEHFRNSEEVLRRMLADRAYS